MGTQLVNHVYIA